MKDLRHKLREDEGMSLVELVFASALGLLVLTVAYLIFETGMNGFRQVQNQTVSGRTAASTLERIDRPVREAGAVSVAEGQRLEVRSDWDDDGTAEWTLFWIPPGSTDLMMQRTPGATHAASTTVTLARGIANGTAGVPLFTYFRSVGVPVEPLASGETTADAAKIVRVTVLVQPESQPPAPQYKAQTDIFLRNR